MTLAKPEGTYRFFFNKSRKPGKMSCYFRTKWFYGKELMCFLPCETKSDGVSMQGWATSVKVEKGTIVIK